MKIKSLTQLYNRLEELNNKADRIRRTLRDYPETYDRKKEYEDRLDDTRNYEVTLPSVIGDGEVTINYTAEVRQMSKTIIHLYENMERYKRSLIIKLYDIEQEKRFVEQEIEDHWFSRLSKILCNLGFNMSLAGCGF